MNSTGAATMLNANRTRQRTDEYATAEEFCAVFNQEMDALYSLSLVLTGDHVKAEQCFVSALDDCLKSTGVFKQWKLSWSRLAIIENAIRLVKPAYETVAGSLGIDDDEIPEGVHHEVAPVMRLNAFHRFVYVLSVLDRYSARDCAVLLKCAWHDIERARRRALEFIGAAGVQMISPLLPALESHQPA